MRNVLLALCVGTAAAKQALDDKTIRVAVRAWFHDRAAAEAAYGHIKDWATSGVTDMSYLFCASDWNSKCNTAAASFNEDIGAWDTSGVTTMYAMFRDASAFNGEIGGWAVHNVKNMRYMFREASAFNQDLGWCVAKKVELHNAFDKTKCASMYCGVMWETNTGDCDMSRTGNVMVNWKIRWATYAWVLDPTAAEATYGHISTWDTSRVTDMSWLFSGARLFNEDISAWDVSGATTTESMFLMCRAFNRDIGAWDTSGVTTMGGMFYGSAFNRDISGWAVHSVMNMQGMFEGSAFNQDIGRWAVQSVTDMEEMFQDAASFNQDIGAWANRIDSVTDMVRMFSGATAFDQDLGWCVADEVKLVDDEVKVDAFDETKCASTSCGVVQVADVADCPTPARKYPRRDDWLLWLLRDF